MSSSVDGLISHAAAHCAALVRERNIDHYLATLFLPADIRDHIYALYAFDAEIMKIRSVIKEPMMGEIRLQWWRDIISGERAGEAANNPVASQLMRTIEKFDLAPMGFDNFLKAQIFDLYSDPMPDKGTFEGYAGETASFLYYQMARMMSGTSDRNADGMSNCAGHAGVASTILRTLKCLPPHRSRRQCYVPAEILTDAGVTLDEYYSAENETSMSRLVGALTAYLLEHQNQFRRSFTALSPDVKPVFLPMCLVSPYISRFEKRAVIASKTPVDIAQWRKQIYLWRAARNGEY